MEPPLRVFVIHRYRLLTDALDTALAEEHDIELVGRAVHLGEATRRLAELEADVALVEVGLDELSSRPMIRHLKGFFPDLKVVSLGLETNDQILECIEAGANGYLRLEATLSELVSTLRLVGDGKARCSPEVAVSIFARIAELARHDEERSRHHPRNLHLTRREEQVLERLGRGLRNKEIARELEIAVPTVKNHVHKVLEKLGVKRRREAVRMAYEMGILDDPLHPSRRPD